MRIESRRAGIFLSHVACQLVLGWRRQDFRAVCVFTFGTALRREGRHSCHLSRCQLMMYHGDQKGIEKLSHAGVWSSSLASWFHGYNAGYVVSVVPSSTTGAMYICRSVPLRVDENVIQ
jgi:hypothetical protein